MRACMQRAYEDPTESATHVARPYEEPLRFPQMRCSREQRLPDSSHRGRVTHLLQVLVLANHRRHGDVKETRNPPASNWQPATSTGIIATLA